MNKTTLMLFMLGICIGFFVHSFIRPENRGFVGTQAIRQMGFTFTNPLLECEIGDQSSFHEITSFREKLQAVVDRNITTQKASHISIYFRDLNNGPWMGINEKEEFSPSSLLKVPLMMSLYQVAEKNPAILNTRVRYTATDGESTTQNIYPSLQLTTNQEYAFQDLIERMIIYSDNNATKLLSQGITEEAFLHPYNGLGIAPPVLQNGEYYLRVKDYATFFRVLFNASYLTREYSEKALKLLSQSEFRQGLVAGVPDGTVVAHKFGERVWGDTGEHQMHDCGIVYYPAKPYLLCVMTQGRDFSSLTDVVSGISKFVYEEVQAQQGKK